MDVLSVGPSAARASFHYTLKTTDGGAYLVWSDMVVLLHGKIMFLIGMGSKQGEEVATTELEQMLKSIEIPGRRQVAW